ncbi:hypothetical protein BD779DRAFT_1469981 [Infundibulicybe gibba]|nr:hypothetical protein BD779DRAFT_1469981 [Infundibulicybe gibba]
MFKNDASTRIATSIPHILHLSHQPEATIGGPPIPPSYYPRGPRVPGLVRQNDAEVAPNTTSPPDGHVTPGDGVIITNSTLRIPNTSGFETTLVRTKRTWPLSLAKQRGDVYNIIQAVPDASKKDKTNRGEFTKSIIASLMNVCPGWNFITCHTTHVHQWGGAEEPD